jgi:CubicO group peptidase (beta-lactamase class C family)
MQKAFSASGLAALRETLDRHVTDDVAPGAVGLVHRRGETHVFVAGTRTIGEPEPMTRDTIFRIASMTKAITAAALMMLVDGGDLALDDPVERWLPELADRRVLRSIDAPLDDTTPAERPILVEDVLSFRLGLGLLPIPLSTYPILREIERLGLVGFSMPNPTAPLDNDAWLQGLGTLPLMAQPGAEWLYTTGSNVQGVLVARVTGKPLSRFLEERIFGPLGMSDTGFWVPADKAGRFVSGYHGPGKTPVRYDDPAASAWGAPPTFEAGDSGLVSTLDDYLAFALMLLSRGRHRGATLLSEAAVDALTTNHLTAGQRARSAWILGEGRGWGFGVATVVERVNGGPNIGTFGWSGGLGTSWLSDPAEDLTTILLTQRMFAEPSGPPVHHAFQEAAIRALA